MNAPRRSLALLLALCLSLPAMALDLPGAMRTLHEAKAAGRLGEQADGYLGVVGRDAQAAEIARLINQARRNEYQKLAEQNRLLLSEVEAMAGRKAIDKSPAGHFVRIDGRWQRK